MPYCDQTDLENALGKQIVKAIFDDDMDGTADAAPLAACLAYGTAECDSFLAGTYDIELPVASVPDVLKFAAVDFCVAYATRRRPDVVKAMGAQPWTTFRDDALEKMKRFAKSIQRLPEDTGTPANVGAEVRSGDPEAPELPEQPRTWQDMGDY
jgi:phage gp36-like protein